jgi:predicted enzyme related to lactoylglutathione lyase
MEMPMFTYVPLATDDVERCAAFYRELGMQIEPQLRHGAHEFFIRGAVGTVRASDMPSVMRGRAAFAVGELDQVVNAALNAGGRVILPKFRAGCLDYALIEDPFSNPLGLCWSYDVEPA